MRLRKRLEKLEKFVGYLQEKINKLTLELNDKMNRYVKVFSGETITIWDGYFYSDKKLIYGIIDLQERTFTIDKHYANDDKY